MATLIPADSSQPEREVKPRNGFEFHVDELHELVGGYIEMFATIDGRMMVCNDESKLVDNPVKNERASKLLRFMTNREFKQHVAELQKSGGVIIMGTGAGGGPDDPCDYIAGDVVVCSMREVGE